jgi:hypothetical protein
MMGRETAPINRAPRHGKPVSPIAATKLLEQSTTLPEIFDVVKEVVRRHLKVERSGLMLGLSNLGGGTGHLVGGFFQVAGNMIVMNSMPLARIRETNPPLYKPYVFHILLHEYIHSIGYLDEASTRPLVLQLSETAFGKDHMVSELARGWHKYMPNLVYPVVGWQPEGGFSVEVVRGFDPGATSYIQ